jgi:hypothetical protein
MKRILLILSLTILAFCAKAQSPFRFEVLAGGGMDVQLYRGEGDLNRGRFVLGGTCCYLFNDNLDICAKYLFSPTYSLNGYHKYRAHTFTLAGEYLFLRDRSVRPYIALGAGPQYVHTIESSTGKYHGTTMGVLGETGVEVNRHFKVSLGSFHQGYLFWNNTLQPFMFLTLGWVL